MDRQEYSKMSLGRHGENLYPTNDISTDSDHSRENTRSTSHHKRIRRDTTDSEDDHSKTHKKTVKKAKKKTGTRTEKSQIARSHSKKRAKSTHRKKVPHPHPPENLSTLKDNYSLRIKLQEMKKNIQSKEKKIKRLYDNIFEEREEIKALTAQANDSRKKEVILQELSSKIKTLQQNEISLMRELSDQQNIAKDALNKLYELQEESVAEIERIKKYYQEFYQQQNKENQEDLESQLQVLKRENERLTSTLRDFESLRSLEKASRSTALSNEIVSLNSQLNLKAMENERLKNEVADLRNLLNEREEVLSLEKKNLKATIQELTEQNRALRSSEEAFSQQEFEDRLQMKRRIDQLERELEQKDEQLKDQEKYFRDLLDKTNNKSQGLHRELKKLSEYEVRIEQLERELEIKENEIQLSKKYYKEKLNQREKSQKDQKEEWSKIYTELLSEIRGLKLEIDNLGLENKKLLSSVNSRSYKDD